MRLAVMETLSAVREAVASPQAREEFSPLGGQFPMVLPEPVLKEIATAADAGTIIAGLTSLPCPIIGLTEADDQASPPFCDLLVSSDAELINVAANSQRAPIAAMSLIQLLRLGAHLSVPHALVAESLAFATLQAGPEFAAWLAARPPAEADFPADDGPPVLLDRHGDRLDITLNRPRRRNAISVEMRDSLCEAFAIAVADPAIRRVTLRGEGRCFSIGGDVSEFGTSPNPAIAHAIRSARLPALFANICSDRLEAHLHGACIGAGIELPAFATWATADRKSFFQLPELQFGLIPGAGGTVSLPRRIGRQRTAWLALTGRRINADTALRWGLIDKIDE